MKKKMANALVFLLVSIGLFLPSFLNNIGWGSVFGSVQNEGVVQFKDKAAIITDVLFNQKKVEGQNAANSLIHPAHKKNDSLLNLEITSSEDENYLIRLVNRFFTGKRESVLILHFLKRQNLSEKNLFDKFWRSDNYLGFLLKLFINNPVEDLCGCINAPWYPPPSDFSKKINISSEWKNRTKHDLDAIQKSILKNDAAWNASETPPFTSFLAEGHEGLGWIKEEIEESMTIPYEGVLYDIYDWRNVNGTDWTTPIRNQTGCGSCTAFSLIGALECLIQLQAGFPFGCDLSEAHLFFCGGGNCRKGWRMSQAIDYLRVFGVPDELCFPYNSPFNLSCGKTGFNWEERVIKVAYAKAITPTCDNIRNALLKYGPLVCCMNVYEDFLSYRGGIYKHVWGDFIGFHGVTLVGYNNIDGYWICKNSWGKNWGEDGWFRIKYGQCDIGNPAYYFSGLSGNHQPFTPSNPLPRDGQSIIRNEVTLTWKCKDYDGDNLTYDIYLTKERPISGNNLIEQIHNQTVFHVTNLTINATYYWKVVAEDERGSKAEGPVWMFTTCEDTLPFVNISGPQKGFIYVGGKKIPYFWHSLQYPIIIGEFNVTVDAYDVSGIERVEFYVNDILRYTTKKEPYVWNYDGISSNLKVITVKAVAHDKFDNVAQDEVKVRYLNLGQIDRYE